MSNEMKPTVPITVRDDAPSAPSSQCTQSTPFLGGKTSTTITPSGTSKRCPRQKHRSISENRLMVNCNNSDFLDLRNVNRRFAMRRKLLMLGTLTFSVGCFALTFLLFHQVILTQYAAPQDVVDQLPMDHHHSPLVSPVILFVVSVVVTLISLLLLCPMVNVTLTSHYCQLFQLSHPTLMSPVKENTPAGGRFSRSNSTATTMIGAINAHHRYLLLLSLFNILFIFLWACTSLIMFNLMCQIFIREGRGTWIDMPTSTGLLIPSQWIELESIDVHLLTILFVILFVQFVLPFNTRINFCIQILCFALYLVVEFTAISTTSMLNQQANRTITTTSTTNIQPQHEPHNSISDIFLRKVSL